MNIKCRYIYLYFLIGVFLICARHHEQHTSNKIQLMLQRMNDNAYNANLGLDDYFFFQIPTKLGEGTTKTNYPNL